MLHFKNVEDMQKVWSLGSINLNPGFLRLIQWSPSFSPTTYRNTFAQVWVRFWDLGYAYWDHQTLFEIAMGVGTPVKLDPKTANMSVGLYARILIDVDFSRPLLQQLRISRFNGDSTIVGLEYESQPLVCSICGLIGHVASKCKVKTPPQTTSVIVNRGRPLDRPAGSRRRTTRSRKPSQRRHLNGEVPPSVDTAKEVSFEPLNVANNMPQMIHEPTHEIATIMDPVAASPSLSALPELPIPQSISSDSSIPPGFRVKHGATEGMASSSSSPLHTGAVVFGSTLDGLHSAATSSAIPEEPREEGEFTPVLSKKTKKKSKIAAKASTKPEKVKVKVKPGIRANSTSSAFLMKGAKHKFL